MFIALIKWPSALRSKLVASQPRIQSDAFRYDLINIFVLRVLEL